MRMIEKLSQKYMIYTIIGILVLLSSVTIITFAMLTITSTQEESNIITTLTCMEVSIEGQNDSLNLSNTYPISNKQGKALIPYTFKVKNNCNTYVDYQVVMSVINTSTLINEDFIKIALDGPKRLGPSALSTIEKETYTDLMDGTLNNYILVDNVFEGNKEHVYDFRMWLNGDSVSIWDEENLSNSSLTVKLSIIGVSRNKPSLLKSTVNIYEATAPFLEGPINRNQVEKLNCSTINNVPKNALGSWDVSENKDQSIMAWYEQTGTNGRYKVTLGQTGGVLANTNTIGMFSNLIYLTDLDLTNFNTKFVVDMSYMFYNIGNELEPINVIGLENLDVSNTHNMSYMFNRFIENKENYILDLSNWNVSNVTTMSHMFDNALLSSANSTINISSWDISNTIDMSNMFDSSGFTNLKLSYWDLPSAIKDSMLINVNAESSIYVKNANLKAWIETETDIPVNLNIIIEN